MVDWRSWQLNFKKIFWKISEKKIRKKFPEKISAKGNLILKNFGKMFSHPAKVISPYFPI